MRRMGGKHHSWALLCAVAAVAACSIGLSPETAAADPPRTATPEAAGPSSVPAAQGTWRSRVAPKLLSAYDGAVSAQAPQPSNPRNTTGTPSTTAPHTDAQGRVQVDVHYDCALDPPLAALTGAGLSIGAKVKLPPLCVIEGWVAPASLSRVAALAGVRRVTMPSYALPLPPPAQPPPKSRIRSAPRQPSQASGAQAQAITASSLDGNGVLIMHADQFVAQTGTTGAGVTVGVQSIGVSNISVIQGRGELPTVNILTPQGSSGSPAGDEGTALLEEVHAVAPGAGLAFCGPNTFIEYTSCLGQLIQAGTTILVDDVVFPEQDLMSTDGAYAQAVGQILTQNPGVALFTSAGNYNGSYWEGSYSPVAVPQGLPPLTCPNGTGQLDQYVANFNGTAPQVLTVEGQGGTFPVTLAWADPFGHNVSNFDLFWVDSNNAIVGCLSSSASPTDTLITERVSFSPGSYTVYVATPDMTLQGKFLKLWFGGDGLTSISLPTPGSIISPQSYGPGVITIGAVKGSDGIGNGIEPFSSLGPISVMFPSPAKIQAPVLVAPDGIYVDANGTYFANVLFPDGNFYGTSAAVPNAGAVAALLRGAFPNLTVPQVLSALQTGAAQLGAVTPDGTFGYGRIDAMGALGTLASPTITALPDSTLVGGTSTQAYPFTVSGTGNLHFSVTSSNALLVPASIVAAGTPGVTVSPSTCGTSTMTCTVTVTAATGRTGTTVVTFSAVDGANRSAPATMNVTISDPGGPIAADSPNPASSGNTGGAGGGGGGALGWLGIVLLALLAGWRALRRELPGRYLSGRLAQARGLCKVTARG